MKDKYLVIVAFFLLVQSTYAQSNSFLKIFDNGELGKEYVGGIYNEKDSIKLFSSKTMNENLDGGINLRSISKQLGTFENLYTQNINQSENYSITNTCRVIDKYIFTGFHKTAPFVSDNNYFLFGFENGKKIFNVVLGKENISDISRGITVDNERNIIISGHVWQKNSEFDYDAFVSKHDTLGNTIWHTVIPARYSNLGTDNPHSLHL